jgi:methylphosphotriester-DNA--protein-cysteine methyltransferase
VQARLDDDPRWRRIVARDRSADGSFWYSVSIIVVFNNFSFSRNVKVQGRLKPLTRVPAAAR